MAVNNRINALIVNHGTGLANASAPVHAADMAAKVLLIHKCNRDLAA